MSKVLFVVGPPGVGKTTLVRELLGMQGSELPIGGYLVDKPKWTVVPEKACAAGHYNGGTFDGADMVPYNGVQFALEHWAENLCYLPLTIFDGDRFSHEGVLNFLSAYKVKVRCVHVTAPEEVLTRHRAARGSKQNEAWMRGRATKAARFSKLIAGALELPTAMLPQMVESARRYVTAP